MEFMITKKNAITFYSKQRGDIVSIRWNNLKAIHKLALEAIPGLAELENAYNELDRLTSDYYKSMIDYMFACPEGKKCELPVLPKSQYDRGALEKAYPAAAAYHKAMEEAKCAARSDIADIYERTIVMILRCPPKYQDALDYKDAAIKALELWDAATWDDPE